MERTRLFRPERAKTYQPGATPRVYETKGDLRPERAQQIRRISRLYRPFRAWNTFCFRDPGRCPGLIYGCPCGASAKAQHQNSRFGLRCVRPSFSRPQKKPAQPPMTRQLHDIQERGYYSVTTRGGRGRRAGDQPSVGARHAVKRVHASARLDTTGISAHAHDSGHRWCRFYRL
jgi:hypothetical protein